MTREPEKPIKVNRVLGKETPLWGIHPVQVLPFSVFGVVVLLLYSLKVLSLIETALFFLVVAIGWTILTRNKITEYLEHFDEPPKQVIRGRLRYKPLKGKNIKNRIVHKKKL